MRMWEIRENTGHYGHDYRMGMREKSVKEAYECGFEEGYEEAMKELEHHHLGHRMGERYDYGERGRRSRY